MRIALSLCLVASPAVAQRLTEGVFLPDGDVAAGEGAAMWENNPAGVGFGAPLELAYTYVDSQADARGDGHQLALAFGLDPFRAGLSLQFLDALPGVEGDGATKVSLGYALRLSPAFSFGFAWHTFVHDEDPALDEADTWDIGFQLRPARWLAAGVTVNDLTSPAVGGVIVNRSYSLGISVRPGTERLTLSGSVVLPEDVDDGDNRPWTAGGLVSLRLFGSVGLQARFETAEYAESDSVHRSLRAMVGLADLSGLGLGVFGYSPDLGGEEVGGYAISTRLRSSVPATPTLFARPKVVEVSVTSGAEFGAAGFFGTRPETPFLDTLITLRRLAKVEDVAGVLLSFGTDDLGWAQAAELRQAVKDLRAAGKKVYAWLPVGDTRTYTVAAAADAIYAAPAGGLLLTGIRAELTFVGELLEKLGVSAEFIAVGAFKSAPEMFTRKGPSDPARASEDALLDDLFAHVVAAIADGRGLTPDAVKTLINQGPYTARAAKEAGLLDGVVHYDEFEDIARTDFGPRVAFADAERLLEGSDPRWGIQPAIGVLYVVGTITDGRSTRNPFGGEGTTGAESFVRAARAMRDDSSVKAVVLRIDSPGGSVTAADAMWRELSRLAEEKPLIVSMGNVAASGGYYVAAPAKEILALPETITGSIGIFTGKFDITGLLGRVGIHREVFTRGENAAILSTAQPWTDPQRAKVQDAMQVLYDLFLDRVVAGRTHLSLEKLAPLAGGRVWTGAQARACGLVDRPAGFMTAVDAAAFAAELAEGDYRLQVQLPESGFGGLPTSPIFAPIEALVQALAAPEQPILPLITQPLRRLVTQPLLQFESETPLALLPFEWK